MSKKIDFLDISGKRVQGLDISVWDVTGGHPTEYKTVQSSILAYAEEIGWSYVPRDEAPRDGAGFAPHSGALPDDGAREFRSSA